MIDLPHDCIEFYNKGTYYLQQKKYAKGVTYLKKSLKIYQTVDAWLNLGTCYKSLDKDIFCVSAFKNATSSSIYCMETSFSIPALAFNNLGLMAYTAGNDTLAEQYYRTAIDIWKNCGAKEDFHDCVWNLATCVLRQVCAGAFSRWPEAWSLYESRFKKSAAVCVHPIFGSIADRVWLGQRGARVVVAQEQGIGDNIMFSRFIPQLIAEYELIACDLQVADSLGSLLRTNGISAPEKIDVRDYDYVLPLGSICGFVSSVDRAAYIAAPSKREFGPGLNIGIVWSGSSAHTNDRHRSCPSGYFKFLTQYGTLWNLNPGACNVPSWVNSLSLPSWTDTACALAGLDFVVCVDTSIAHMCGAMGIPCYMLQPYKESDFRWGDNTCGTENIWYDSVKVIRNPQDWSICIENLKKELLS